MQTDYSYKRLFIFFKQFITPYWGIFLVSTFCSAISSAVSLYNAYAVATIVNFVISFKQGNSFAPLYTTVALWAAAIVVRYVTLFISRHFGMSTAEKAGKDAEIYAIKHLSLLNIAWHEKENTGNKLKKIDRAAQNIIDATRLWLGSIVDIAVSVVGSLIILAKSDRTVALILIFYLTVYYFVARFTRSRAIKAMKAVKVKDEEITGFFYEIAANIRTVKVLGMAKKILGFANKGAEEYAAMARRRVFWFQVNVFLRGIWEGIGRISLFLFVIYNILQGRYPAGFLVLFYSYFNNLSSSISSLSDVAQEVSEYKINVGRLAEILDEPVTIDGEQGKKEFPKQWRSIFINNLTFKYGNNIALNGITIEIKKGEKVGIVGLSGAGKSTLFKMLLKEYEDYGGEILIGDVSLKDIKKSDYTRHIAAVLQETEVFNMSLKNNIILVNGDEEHNEELLNRSLDIAHVRDFVPKPKEGIDTLIGEKGIKLSGGERQRLGLARAVFKNPEILFLDEATSHLDIESEQKIQDSLKKFFKDVTAVVIAHRLTTVKEMDRIIVIENGKIIEEGPFNSLYESNGRFRMFWDRQKIS